MKHGGEATLPMQTCEHWRCNGDLKPADPRSTSTASAAPSKKQLHRGAHSSRLPRTRLQGSTRAVESYVDVCRRTSSNGRISKSTPRDILNSSGHPSTMNMSRIYVTVENKGHVGEGYVVLKNYAWPCRTSSGIEYRRPSLPAKAKATTEHIHRGFRL